MNTYHFKLSLSGKYMFVGVNLKKFPTNEQCISVLECHDIKTERTFLLKNSRRGVKKFQTWLKNYKTKKL